VLVAVDEIIPFSTNQSLFGHLLVWRRVADEWRFYERVLQEGGESGAYPEAARHAHRTDEVLAVIAQLRMPDTSTILAEAPSIAVEPLLFGAAVGGTAWFIKGSRRRV
jgi:hypothetical protein